MNREYHKWWSPRLKRDMELLVFGHSGAKVLVFPTRGGRFYEYEKLRITESLRHKIEAGQLQLFCVDGIDSESFYCFWAHPVGRVQRYVEYEEYILNEVMPFMQMKNQHECTISHGCSLGAFFAANIAFKHPHLFKKLCVFSGRYNLTEATDDFSDLLAGYYDETVYYNTPVHFLKNMHCHERLEAMRNMDIVMVCGKQDPFLGNNHYLCQLLHEKGVPHRMYEWQERAHRGYYWRRMAPIYV